MTTKKQPDPSNDHQTTSPRSRRAVHIQQNTKAEFARLHFRIESADDQNPPPKKNAHGKHQKKRMANKEFSTIFSKSVLKVPRVQNNKKCGWCRGCQTVKKTKCFIVPFCVETNVVLDGRTLDFTEMTDERDLKRGPELPAYAVTATSGEKVGKTAREMLQQSANEV